MDKQELIEKLANEYGEYDIIKKECLELATIAVDKLWPLVEASTRLGNCSCWTIGECLADVEIALSRLKEKS